MSDKHAVDLNLSLSVRLGFMLVTTKWCLNFVFKSMMNKCLKKPCGGSGYFHFKGLPLEALDHTGVFRYRHNIIHHLPHNFFRFLQCKHVNLCMRIWKKHPQHPLRINGDIFCVVTVRQEGLLDWVMVQLLPWVA